MEKISDFLIDYSLFEKYDKEYFIENKILPISEDDICIKFLVCSISNLSNIKSKFEKLSKFYEVEDEDILFYLSNIEINIKLYSLVYKILDNSIDDENYIEEFINLLLKFSIESRSSDIHIENYKHLIQFRFRIDGKLKIFFSFKKEFFEQFSSYIKLISNLDITQNRLPLNSRFSKTLNEKSYDFRVSTMPTIIKESIVIRILDKQVVDKSIFELGLSSHLILKLKKAINLKQGLILIAGPTGSGKTTTLYSIIKELRSEEKKIITIEDPVEYHIEDINQIPVNEKIGLNYELVLKNILRQDPDIILIGEIRDRFSLDMALRASLTGHLVIASIHSNSAVETITRLYDLNENSYLIANTLKLIMSQRLILKYCTFCNAQGCKKCNFTKYYGRTAIAEVLNINENLSSMIFKKENIKDYIKTIDFKTILEDGKQKASLNISSMDEVFKVV